MNQMLSCNQTQKAAIGPPGELGKVVVYTIYNIVIHGTSIFVLSDIVNRETESSRQ